ncbi:uncharacterized protein [Heterodontus francisci]|uniref:uncharacterized protein n=1 Tax=Heterodontus francisci TaxID=7792 RepID=UPI00355C86BB
MSNEITQSSGNPTFSKNSSPDANTPTVAELEEILRNNRVPLSRIDEVWPNLYIGDLTVAHDRFHLWKLGITHVLNAAHKQVASSGCQDFYGTSVDYYGIAARDLPNFDIAAYFHSASEYIHQAVDILGGKIFVHCAFGYSRSASLVLAYLMTYHHLSLLDAVKTVTTHRRIFPNRGFLKQLLNFDRKLQQERIGCEYNLKLIDPIGRASPVPANSSGKNGESLHLIAVVFPNSQSQRSFAYMSAAESLSGDNADLSTSNTISDSTTPSITELENILESSSARLNHVDEVWPNLYIGDLVIAHDKKQLRKMGITHVLNAAHSKWGSVGDQIFYGKKINYYGIAADDSPDFDLSIYFYTAAEQIHQTLNTPDAKLLVHCILGMSRSASLVLAYLMIYHNRSLLSAVNRVILYRPISPNWGFLEQLRNLDIQLNEKKKWQCTKGATYCSDC